MPDRTIPDKEHAQFEAHLRAAANRKEVLEAQDDLIFKYPPQLNHRSRRRATLPQDSYSRPYQISSASQKPTQKVQFTPSVDERQSSKWSSSATGHKTGRRKKLRKIDAPKRDDDNATSRQRTHSWISKLRFSSMGHSSSGKDGSHHNVRICASAWRDGRKYSELTYRQPLMYKNEPGTAGQQQDNGIRSAKHHQRTKSNTFSFSSTNPTSCAHMASATLPPSTSYTPTRSHRRQTSASRTPTTSSLPSSDPYQQATSFQRSAHGPPMTDPSLSTAAYAIPSGQPRSSGHETGIQYTGYSSHGHQSLSSYQQQPHQAHRYAQSRTRPHPHSFASRFNPQQYHPPPNDPYWQLVPPNPPGPRLKLEQVIAAAKSRARPAAGTMQTCQTTAPPPLKTHATAPSKPPVAAPFIPNQGHPPKADANSKLDSVTVGVAEVRIASTQPATKRPHASSNGTRTGIRAGDGVNESEGKRKGSAQVEAPQTNAAGGVDPRKGTRDAAGRAYQPKWDDASKSVIWGYW